MNVVCPHCDAKFRSKKDLTGKTARCPRCDESFVAGEEDFDAPGASLPQRTPPKAAPKAATAKAKKTSRGKKRRKRAGGGIPKPVVIGGVVLVVGGLIWAGLSQMELAGVNLPNLGDIPGMSTIPGVADTASSLTDELVACANDLRKILATVRDTGSSDAAVEDLLALSERLIDIQQRAAHAEFVTEEEIKSLRQRSNAEADQDGLLAEMKRIADSGAVTENLEGGLFVVSMAIKDAANAIFKGLQPLPEPKNDFEKLEQQRALLHRQAMLAVMDAADADDFPAVVGRLNEIESELEALAEQKAGMVGSQMSAGQAELKYLPFSSTYDEQMRERVNLLEQRGVDVASLTSASVGVSTADSKISFAQPQRRSRDTAPGSQQADSGDNAVRPTSERGQPPYAGGRGQPRNALPGRRAMPTGRGGRPVIPTGPASAGEIIVNVKADLFGQRPTGDAEEWKIISAARSELSRDLQIRLKEITGPGRTHGNITGGACEIRISYDGDPQAVADRIDFGNVDSVDAAARRIEVTLTR